MAHSRLHPTENYTAPKNCHLSDTLIETFIHDCDKRLQTFIHNKKTQLTNEANLFAQQTHNTLPQTTEPVTKSYRPDDSINMLFQPLFDLAHGGKRTRARLTLLGFFSITTTINESSTYTALVNIASAIELFQLAALIHDDIIDESDTRRGLPTTHNSYSRHHATTSWNNAKAKTFGHNAAILLGDIALAFANELYFEHAVTLPGEKLPALYRSNQLFLAMHSQVMLGQFLDIYAENIPLDALSPSRTRLIAILKSALYSVSYPLQLGAIFAEANPHQLEQLRSYALPLGQAFQFQDDILGVFGDQKVTGKPNGDDIIEGKHTLLVTYAFELLDATGRQTLESTLGNPDATPGDIENITHLIKQCGALTKLEHTITTLCTTAAARMPSFIPAATQKALTSLSEDITHRNA